MTAAGLDASARLGSTVVDDLAVAIAVSSPGEREALTAALALLERKIEILLDQTPPPAALGREPDTWDDEMTEPAPALARLT
jgi:hypothetical protein